MLLLRIQYLTQPVAVLQEAHRVLRPGGSVIISFTKDFFSYESSCWLARQNTSTAVHALERLCSALASLS
jgi:ubiquinone/menaquinone biosynthesis C-methylase UbiE